MLISFVVDYKVVKKLRKNVIALQDFLNQITRPCCVFAGLKTEQKRQFLFEVLAIMHG